MKTFKSEKNNNKRRIIMKTFNSEKNQYNIIINLDDGGKIWYKQFFEEHLAHAEMYKLVKNLNNLSFIYNAQDTYIVATHKVDSVEIVTYKSEE